MQANGVFPEVEPGVRTIASPLDIAGVDKVKPRMAPEIGQHTIEVLESLGYSREAILDLLKRRAAMDPSVPQQQFASVDNRAPPTPRKVPVDNRAGDQSGGQQQRARNEFLQQQFAGPEQNSINQHAAADPIHKIEESAGRMGARPERARAMGRHPAAEGCVRR